jgi:hypothetical protein
MEQNTQKLNITSTMRVHQISVWTEHFSQTKAKVRVPQPILYPALDSIRTLFVPYVADRLVSAEINMRRSQQEFWFVLAVVSGPDRLDTSESCIGFAKLCHLGPAQTCPILDKCKLIQAGIP